MRKFYLICLLLVAGGYANEQSDSIEPKLDINEIFNNVLNCVKFELADFDNYQFDEELVITEDVQLSKIFGKNLMKFDQSITNKISIGPGGIGTKVNVTLTWVKLILGTDYNIDLELLPPLFPGAGAIAMLLQESGVSIEVVVNLVSNPPAGGLPFKISSVALNLIPGSIQAQKLVHNEQDMTTVINPFLAKHVDDLADILNYLINDLLQSIFKAGKSHPLIQMLKAKGARGLEACIPSISM